jgi:uncharacterized protein (TIGR02246 family)
MLKPMRVLIVAAGASFFALLSGCKVAPDSRTADVQAIRDSEAAWEKAFATKAPEKAEAFYADDADSMLPDTPLMAGKQAILAGMKPELGDPNFSLFFSPAKVEVAQSGDIAYTQGRFAYTTTDPKTGKRVGQSGNYVEVYKKQADGSWKVEEDIATEETPLMPLTSSK